MPAELPTTEKALEGFREYLRLLARLRLDKRVQGKLDPSDLVQQTMLEAYQALPRYEARGEKELAAWLRQILARNLANAVRDLGRAKRDVKRERSLHAALDQSSSQLGAWLAGHGPSPSRQVRQREQAVVVANALSQLPEGQREVLILHYFEGLTLAEVSEQVGKSTAAVGGLLHRGLKQLRETLAEPGA